MKSSENQTQSPDTAAAALPVRPVSPSRRRLLRGGLIGAPALLALKSTPVMACNCALPSGFSVSGNNSNNARLGCRQPASQPGWWPNQVGGNGCYGKSSCKPGDSFSTHFVCTGYSSNKLSTHLAATSSTQAMFLACYFQACSDGGTQFPLPATLKDVWEKGVCGSGYPVPGSTAVWDSTKSIAYLKFLTGQSPN